MTFDDDVLSALEEAFGADSASLMEELEPESATAGSEAQTEGESSLDELVSQLDLDVLQATKPTLPDQPQRRSRSNEDKQVLVLLGDSYYGLPMKNIIEIQQLPSVTYFPNLPEWIPGVCNLRGNIVSIVDLKLFLGFDPTALNPKTRLVVVRTENQDLTTGFVVDEVVRITEVEPAKIRRPSGRLESQLEPYLMGTYETPDAVTCILDLEAILNSPTLRLE